MHLDMTPLIDMVFLLLIFFVLSSQFVSQKGFKVKLPKAANAQIQKNKDVTVVISKEGQILLGGKEVLLKDLKGAVFFGLKGASSKALVIKADEGVPLGLVVKVMDVAKEVNVEGLVISTQSSDHESGN
jgi:biopolymer transport protein ExbD